MIRFLRDSPWLKWVRQTAAMGLGSSVGHWWRVGNIDLLWTVQFAGLGAACMIILDVVTAWDVRAGWAFVMLIVLLVWWF